MASVLQRQQVDAIDVAHSKYFADPATASDREIAGVRQWWVERGIDIVGMQSLLFGRPDLNLFGTHATQRDMLGHLAQVCRVARQLGASRLVFGSPRNRDRAGLSDLDALAIATAFFRKLGDLAQDAGVVVCLEPNPPEYGANFMTTAAETALTVAEVGHPAIKMQFDTGAISITGEEPGAFFEEHADLVGHVHASEPSLLPLGDGTTDHAVIARCLRQWLPGHIVTIEMLVPAGSSRVGVIERSIAAACRAYASPSPRVTQE